MISSPGRHMLDGLVRVIAAEALLPITGLITAAYLSRKLGPADYGLFTLATTIFLWMQYSLLSIFSRASMRFIASTRDWHPIGSRVLQFYLLVGAGTAGVFLIIAPSIAELLGEPLLSRYLRIFALGFPILLVGEVYQRFLIGAGHYRGRALTRAARWITRLVLIIFLVEIGWSVTGAILGLIGASGVELVLGRTIVNPPIFQKSRFSLRSMLGYIGPLFVAELCIETLDFDIVFLKALGGAAADAGIFGAAKNISFAPLILGLPASWVLLSTLSRVLRDGGNAPAVRIAQDFQRGVLGGLPFAFITAGMASEIVTLVFGVEYRDGGPVLARLILAGVALVMISTNTSILVAFGRPRLSAVVAIPLVPLAILGHLILIPRYGAIGAASATLMVSVFGTLLSLGLVARVCGAVPPLRSLVRSAVVCAAAYATASYVPVSSLWVIPKFAAIAVGIAFAYLLLGEFTRKELLLLMEMIRPKQEGEDSAKGR